LSLPKRESIYIVYAVVVVETGLRPVSTFPQRIQTIEMIKKMHNIP